MGRHVQSTAAEIVVEEFKHLTRQCFLAVGIICSAEGVGRKLGLRGSNLVDQRNQRLTKLGENRLDLRERQAGLVVGD